MVYPRNTWLILLSLLEMRRSCSIGNPWGILDEALGTPVRAHGKKSREVRHRE